MHYKIKTHIISILLVLWISACAMSVETQPATPTPLGPTAETVTTSPIAAHTSLPIDTAEPAPTETPVVTATPTPVIISPSATPVPTKTEDMGAACPATVLLSDETPSLLTSGSILIQARENGIWAFSKGLADPHFITAPVERIRGLSVLSSNRMQIVFQSDDVVLYDLLTGEQISFPWQESWGARAVSGWKEDGRLELFVRYEKTLGEGVVREIILLDPITLQAEHITQEFQLPDFVFNNMNPFHGFASWNPAETIVLYTGVHPGEGMRYVLRNMITNEEMWRSVKLDGAINPVADWSEDGGKVLMAFVPPRTISVRNPDPIELVSLDVHSLRYEVLSTLTFLPDRAEIRYIAWSFDTRYVFFTLFQTSFRGPGYILDTQDGSILPICGPGLNYGWWLPEANQFLYIVEASDGGDGHELKLLDVPSWQVQTLWQSDGHPHITGWTPVEFSEP